MINNNDFTSSNSHHDKRNPWATYMPDDIRALKSSFPKDQIDSFFKDFYSLQYGNKSKNKKGTQFPFSKVFKTNVFSAFCLVLLVVFVYAFIFHDEDKSGSVQLISTGNDIVSKETSVFQSLSYAGHGPGTIKGLNLPDGEYYFLFTHEDTGYFRVDAYDSNMPFRKERIINSRNRKSDVKCSHCHFTDGRIKVIEAEGDWTLAIIAAPQNDVFLEPPAVFEGDGPQCLLDINLPKGKYKVTTEYSGEGLFQAEYQASGANIIIGFGNFSGPGSDYSYFHSDGNIKAISMQVICGPGKWKITFEKE